MRLCKLEEIPIHGSRGFDPFREGHDTIFVVNTNQGPVAYKDICPHYESTSLPWRKNRYLNLASTKIVCAAHGAEFEITTGMCVSGPCLGRSLTSVPVKVAEDGYILALINR